MQSETDKVPEKVDYTLDGSNDSCKSNTPEVSKKTFATWKIILPAVIGIGVIIVMFIHDVKAEDLLEIWNSIRITPRTITFSMIAFLCMFGRDFGLTWRFRALTNRQLGWLSALKVNMLCEFTSCVTPSAVGGSSLGMVFLWSQGVNFGRATTLMMTTLLLDELFFVVFCPIIAMLTPSDVLFALGDTSFSYGIKFSFWIIYAVIFLWTLLLFLGIIVKPIWIRDLLMKVCNIRFMRKWQSSAETLGNNMVATSRELRNKPFLFWIEAFVGTALSWFSRYLVVNALFLAFVPSANPYQWVILARQLVIWVVLTVSPTPGGSGLSEWLFSEYYGDIVTTAGLALILALFWRIISYYIYLAIGAVIVPGWLKQIIEKRASMRTRTHSTDAQADNAMIQN